MFNDTFVLRSDATTIVCNGPNPDNVVCSKNNIAWPSDIAYKFIKADPSTYTYPNSYFNEEGHVVKKYLTKDSKNKRYRFDGLDENSSIT
jgi:hypothetical protein